MFLAAVAFTLFCTNEGKQMGELAQQIKIWLQTTLT